MLRVSARLEVILHVVWLELSEMTAAGAGGLARIEKTAGAKTGKTDNRQTCETARCSALVACLRSDSGRRAVLGDIK